MKDKITNPEEYLNEDLLLFIRQLIKKYFPGVTPLRLIIFGSRARKDNKKRADFDLAIDIATKYDHNQLTNFTLAIEEDAPTLHKIDIVDYHNCPATLRDSIDREGKIIYEQ